MPTLRELVSKLVVDDKQATKTLGRHDKQIKKTKRSMLELNAGLDLVQKGFGALRTVVRVANRAFDFLIADVATLGDKFAKEGKKIGITATSLQELSFAAERAGADQSKLTKAFAKMGKSLDDIRVRGTGPLADQFEVLGIKFKDFEGLSPEETFGKLADVIASIEDPMKRSAVAQDIFGRSGRDLIPLLVEGSAGIEALRERARVLGLSMTDEAAAGSEVFIDAMTDLKASVQGARFEIGEKLLPVVTEIVKRITNWVIANKPLLQQKITAFVRGFVEIVEKAIPVVGNIVDKIAAFIEKAGGLESVLKLVVGGLIAMKFATIAAAGPWAALALAAVAAGATIGRVLADITPSIQDTRFQIIELGSELRRLQGNRRLFERRGDLAKQEAELLSQLGAGVGTLSLKDFDELRRKLTDVTLRRGTIAQVEPLVQQIMGRRTREVSAAAERGLKGLTGRRRERVLSKAAAIARGRGGGIPALEAAIASVRGGAGRRPTGKGRGGAAATAAPTTDAELLALVSGAVPGADLGAITAGRRVPTAPAPVVTVTVNQTNVDVDVNSPISIEGTAEMNLTELANAITERQGSELDSAVRSAIEAIQPEAVR